MFHRRLVVLGTLVAVVFLLLMLQLGRLTIAQGPQWRAKAEASLEQVRLIPTRRGDILDRKGRVLAMDKPGFDVSVRFPVISGRWSYLTARTRARRAAGQSWYSMTEQDRDQAIANVQVTVDREADAMWEMLAAAGHLSRAELDQRKAGTIRRVQSIVSDVMMRRMAVREAAVDALSEDDIDQPIAEQEAWHPLLTDVDDQGRLLIERLLAQAQAANLKTEPAWGVFRHVRIEPGKHRDYPLETMHLVVPRDSLPSPLASVTPLEITVEGVALHLVGQMRDLWAEDAQPTARPFTRADLGGYLPGDRIGRWGIEATQEATLRGTRGRIIDHLENQTRQQIEPIPGGDVVLSIDAQLQARIGAILQPAIGLTVAQPYHRKQHDDDAPTVPAPGEELGASVVVLDVKSGQVLAAVGHPGFSLRTLRESPELVWNDQVMLPYVHRPVAMPYEPGSTLKPIVLVSAMSQGVVHPGQSIVCNGILDPHEPSRYRCWIFRQYHSTHGPLTAPEAIARSCNIYFYTLGRSMGSVQLTTWFHRFGLGEYLLGRGAESQLSEEMAGDLPDLSMSERPGARGFDISDATLMGIGQGPVRWTVLQAANAYATIARDGVFMEPTFIASRGGRPAAQRSWTLPVDHAGVAETMEGLYDTVNRSYGSGSRLAALGREPIFNLPGVKIYGKSGTADAAPRRIDSDGDQRITGADTIVRSGAHGWFIAMVQREGSTSPDFIIAVVTEYGGSGSAVSGPIANQVLHALRAEGYL